MPSQTQNAMLCGEISIGSQLLDRSNYFRLSTNGLGVPVHGLGVKLLLELQKGGVQRIAIIKLVGLGRGVARVNVVKVRAEGGLGLRLDDGGVDAIDEIGSISADSVILEHEERVTVIVGREGGILGVNGGPRASVQVDNYKVTFSRGLGGVVNDVVIERVQGVGRQLVLLRDGDGLGEESVVLVVAGEWLDDAGLVGHQDKVVVPAVRLDDNLTWRGDTANQFGLDLSVELVNSAEERAAKIIGRNAIEVDTPRDAIISDRRVGAKVLKVQESLSEVGLAFEQRVSPAESEVVTASGAAWVFK